MIKNVKITNYLGESVDIELMHPEKSGIIVEDITGLGPSKADIHLTDLATGDGSDYNSARITARNIVMALSFLANPTIEAVRYLTYKYFPIKKKLQFEIETDTRHCMTYGYVESNEPTIFSNNEGSQISIVCPDPYFYSVGDNGTVTTVFSGIEKQFHFPFSNESLTEKKIIFGNVLSTTEKTVYYNGDASIGIIINIHSIGNASNVTIYNTITRESMSISSAKLVTLTGHDIIAGDDIIISTLRGKKTITLLRNGVYTNILNCLNKNADWFQLSKGDNIFAYSAEVGTNVLQFSIENQTVYEGA